MPHNQNVKTPTNLLETSTNIRVSALAVCLAVSKNTIWRLSREGKFPKPVKLSDKVTIWKTAEVRAWLASKEAA